MKNRLQVLRGEMLVLMVQLGELMDQVKAELKKVGVYTGIRSELECIRDTTAHHLQVTVVDVLGDNRRHHIVFARWVGMALCREFTIASLTTIGEVYGGKDHTTVHYAINALGALIETEPEKKAVFERIRAEVTTGLAALREEKDSDKFVP